MPVYVDHCLPYPHLGRRTGHLLWCHLLADTREELHAFADVLDVPRRAFQDHAVRWHYDIPQALRRQALRLGAVAVDRRTVGLMLRERRQQVPAARAAGRVSAHGGTDDDSAEGRAGTSAGGSADG